MQALILGARGAVGRVIAETLRARGHAVTPAGRSVSSGEQRNGRGIRIDLNAPDGLNALRDAAVKHDVVINASGIESPAIVTALSHATLVDISATARYLAELRRFAEDAPVPARIVLGAGLVPGLSTILLHALEAEPGDNLDLAVVLGGGESRGAAAVAWTAGLAGQALYEPPEGGTVINLREARRLPGPNGPRRHLRADFPDHLLVGVPRGVAVRSYLATDTRTATAALELVGRFPAWRSLVVRAPHFGGSAWSLTAINRRTGAAIGARGSGQSHATGVLTAAMAVAAADTARPISGSIVTAADLLTVKEVARIPGISVSRLSGVISS